MKRQDLMQMGAYTLAAGLAVGGAFLISLKFLGHGHAQNGAPPPKPSGNASPAANQGAPPQPQPGAANATAGTPAPPPPDPAAATNSGIAELEGFLEPFIYDIVNRRDPFQPFAEYVVPEESGPSRAMSPAQRWELEKLKLVGIMWDIKDPKAMFMDPDQEMMVLGRDESIGNRNGYIATIREGEVVVVEAIRKRGDIIYRTRVLRIER